ncbi:RPA-interacting protein-like [Phymastichus coffea]|uniref:RPA-interacting protein-like n=1 Tax=Phymastichus coffea TaxID=108790 RepID=UPI00273B006A|nr:RPA-interacting protein-like [Phymastichus coffea]
MSSFVPQNLNQRIFKKGPDLSKFHEILRKKCQKQMRERREQFFNKGRSGLLSSAEIQETLTEIVRQEFNTLTTAEKSEIIASSNRMTSYPMDQDEALKEENEIIIEQEQWIIQEYERLINSEDEMFDMLQNDTTVCPMCQKSFLEEIPDFIVCNFCGLKVRSDISLEKFKSDLELYVNKHSEICFHVPKFSLLFENNKPCLYMTCTACTSCFLIQTVTS